MARAAASPALREAFVAAKVVTHLIAQLQRLGEEDQGEEAPTTGFLLELEALLGTIVVLVKHDPAARSGLDREACFETPNPDPNPNPDPDPNPNRRLSTRRSRR